MTDRNVVIRLRGEIGDFQAKMVAASRSVGAAADKMTGAEKESQKFRKGLDSLGGAAGKIGLVAGAGIAVAIKSFADFDRAMSGVEAATHAAKGEMDDLRALALKTGADTAFSANEAADGITELAKAGVSTADIMGGALQGALDLAAAGTVDVGYAAETAATAMTQFGISGERVPHVADLLAAAAGKAQGEVSDMAMALKQSGLVASQTGLTLEETTGTLAAFASAGLIGSDAGTSFKTMLQSLTPSSKAARDQMEALGISAYDAQGNFIGITEFAGKLRDGLKGLSVEQQNATLKTIFGSDAVRAAAVIYQQGADGIQGWIDKTNDAGYAAETAQIKMDNLAGDIEKLKGALSTLFIEAGSNGNDFLRGATQSAEDFVNALSSLPEWVSDAAFSLASITAITGGSLWFGSKVIGGIANARVALENLGLTAAQTRTALAAVGKGLQFVAILESVNLLDKAFDDLLDTRLEGSNLQRSLDALAQGRIEGELLSQFGTDLEGFGEQALFATDGLHALQRASSGAPIIGGFLSGSAGDAVDNLEMLDDALARMIESGQRAEAADVFGKLMDAAAGAGADVDKLRGIFDQYEIALANAGEEARDYGTDQRAVAGALDETVGPADKARRGLEDVGHAARDASYDAEALDAAVGNLEATLKGNERARAYEQAIDDLGERMKRRKELLDELADARNQLANPDASGVTDAQRDLAEANRDLAKAKTASEKESAREKVRNAQERISDAQSRVGDSAESIRERVKDLQEQLADYKLTLDIGAQAGRDWQESLEGIAKAALEAGGDLEGMDRVQYLNNARKDFIDLATKITGSREKAKELADELDLLHHKPVKPDLDVDTSDAENDVRKFYRMLEGLKPVVVKLFVDTTKAKNDIGELGDPRFPVQRATGGPVYGAGTGTSDSIPAYLSNGEYVIRAAAVQRYGSGLFDQLNAMRYANGGPVRQMQAQTTTNYYQGGESIDYDRLALAIARVRPIYGDVHVADGTDFQRTLLEDQRRASLSGVR